MKQNVKPQISEKAFTKQIIDLARLFGWKAAHFRPALTQRGRWVTAVQGDGAGFPDLVLVHRGKGRVIFVELKTQIGKLSEKQEQWLDALCEVEKRYCALTGHDWVVRCAVWRPSQFDEITKILWD